MRGMRKENLRSILFVFVLAKSAKAYEPCDKDYIYKDRIHEGKHTEVRNVIHKIEKKEYVIKIFDDFYRNKLDGSFVHEELIATTILKSQQKGLSESLPLIKGFCTYGVYEFRSIIMEKLFDLPKDTGLYHNLDLALDILASIKALHKLRIAHVNIKPSKFMMSKDRIVKLIDFGESVQVDKNLAIPSLTTMIGSPPYTAPERLLAPASEAKKPSTTHVDLLKEDSWAAGVLLFEHFANEDIFSELYVLPECVEKSLSYSHAYLRFKCYYRSAYFYYKCVTPIIDVDDWKSDNTKEKTLAEELCPVIRICGYTDCLSGFITNKIRSDMGKAKWNSMTHRLSEGTEPFVFGKAVVEMLESLLAWNHKKRDLVSKAHDNLTSKINSILFKLHRKGLFQATRSFLLPSSTNTHKMLTGFRDIYVNAGS